MRGADSRAEERPRAAKNAAGRLKTAAPSAPRPERDAIPVIGRKALRRPWRAASGLSKKNLPRFIPLHKRIVITLFRLPPTIEDLTVKGGAFGKNPKRPALAISTRIVSSPRQSTAGASQKQNRPFFLQAPCHRSATWKARGARDQVRQALTWYAGGSRPTASPYGCIFGNPARAFVGAVAALLCPFQPVTPSVPAPAGSRAAAPAPSLCRASQKCKPPNIVQATTKTQNPHPLHASLFSRYRQFFPTFSGPKICQTTPRMPQDESTHAIYRTRRKNAPKSRFRGI